jgi:hypothetical protein
MSTQSVALASASASASASAVVHQFQHQVVAREGQKGRLDGLQANGRLVGVEGERRLFQPGENHVLQEIQVVPEEVEVCHSCLVRYFSGKY